VGPGRRFEMLAQWYSQSRLSTRDVVIGMDQIKALIERLDERAHQRHQEVIESIRALKGEG
jgi:hypothetical protein